MRVSCAAIFTLATLTSLDLNHRVSASPMQIPEQKSNSSNLVVQAQQEVEIIAQQSQSAVQASNIRSDAQYYQDYQKAVVVPTDDAANNSLNQTQLSTNSQPPILNQPSSVAIPVPLQTI